MVASGYGVWIAMDKKPTIKLFHSVTYELVTEVDVTSAVTAMLCGKKSVLYDRNGKASTLLLVCWRLVLSLLVTVGSNVLIRERSQQIFAFFNKNLIIFCL